MASRDQGTDWARKVSPAADPLRKLGNLLHLSQFALLPGFVTALSSVGRGPFPARQRLLAILPGLTLFWPVCALFTRGRS